MDDTLMRKLCEPRADAGHATIFYNHVTGDDSALSSEYCYTADLACTISDFHNIVHSLTWNLDSISKCLNEKVGLL